MPNHMLLMSFDDSSITNLFTSISRFLEYTIGILKHKRKIRFCYIGTAARDRLVEHLFYTGFLQYKFGRRVKTTRLILHRHDKRKQLEEYLSTQDVLFIGGGNTEEMLKIWNNQGFTATLNKLREEDRLPICAGVSAGGMYPFHSGLSYSESGRQYFPLRCLDWFKQSFCPHADSKRIAPYANEEDKPYERFQAYQSAIKLGHLPPGYAVPDHCMLHFYNGDLITAVSSLQDNYCMYVSPDSIARIETLHLTKQNIQRFVDEVLVKLKLKAVAAHEIEDERNFPILSYLAAACRRLVKRYSPF